MANGPRCWRDKPESDFAVDSFILCAGGRAKQVSTFLELVGTRLFLEQLLEKRVIGSFNK
jgi:hypothetical protein